MLFMHLHSSATRNIVHACFFLFEDRPGFVSIVVFSLLCYNLVNSALMHRGSDLSG